MKGLYNPLKMIVFIKNNFKKMNKKKEGEILVDLLLLTYLSFLLIAGSVQVHSVFLEETKKSFSQIQK